jgi:hypothetical protein
MDFSYLYIASNPSMPGLVKIGFTTRSPGDRIRELDSTGVPAPFDVVFVACVDDARILEGLVHQALGRDRLREGREFFAVTVKDAIDAVLRSASLAGIEIYFQKVSDSFAIPGSVLEENPSASSVSPPKRRLETRLGRDSVRQGGGLFKFSPDWPSFEGVGNEERARRTTQEFVVALNSLDPQTILQAWVKIAEHRSTLELTEANRPAYDLYRLKMGLAREDGIDSLLVRHIDELVEKIATLGHSGLAASSWFFEYFAQIFFVLHAPESAERLVYGFIRFVRRKESVVVAAVMFMILGKTRAALHILQASWEGLRDLSGYRSAVVHERLDWSPGAVITEGHLSFVTHQVQWALVVELLLRLSTEIVASAIEEGVINRPPGNYRGLVDAIRASASLALADVSLHRPGHREAGACFDIFSMLNLTATASIGDDVSLLEQIRARIESREYFRNADNFIDPIDSAGGVPCWSNLFVE